MHCAFPCLSVCYENVAYGENQEQAGDENDNVSPEAGEISFQREVYSVEVCFHDAGNKEAMADGLDIHR